MTGRALDERLLERLDRWRDEPVAVRVVVDPDELVAVFVGTLKACVDEKHPALFWPVEPEQGAWERPERPGIYVHRELLSDVRIHVGDFVVEYVQAGVTTNVRRLSPHARSTRS
jgi:hypothetical protein